jgi:hypothetical protein
VLNIKGVTLFFSESDSTRLLIYYSAGQQIPVINLKLLIEGEFTHDWDGAGQPAEIYHIIMATGG